jgi:pilus assembly protein CpaD
MIHRTTGIPSRARAVTARAGALWLLAALPLSGCGVDRLATGSIVPDDYRERHPIVLSQNGETSIDLFTSGARLDRATTLRIRDFVRSYSERGHGPVYLMAPAGGAANAHSRAAALAVRRELARSGLRAPVQIRDYAAIDPNVAAPIRMTFYGLKAAVPVKCGEWPADLASGSTLATWENRPYWNYGCAAQSNLATMVADPRDLAGPRGETPSDVAMRSRAITNVRQGADPGTNWKTQNTNIGQAGGN